MAKKGDIVQLIQIECVACREDKKSIGVSRYSTKKNRRNTTERLELKKYCPYHKKHTVHREVKS